MQNIKSKAKSPFIHPMFVSGQAHQWLWQSPSETHLLDVSLWICALPPNPQKVPTNHFLVLDLFLEARYKLRPSTALLSHTNYVKYVVWLFLFSRLCRLLKCLLFHFLQVCLVFFSFKLWVNILLIYSCWLEGFACCLSLNLRECQNKQF